MIVLYGLLVRSLLVGTLLAALIALPALGEERPALRAVVSVEGPLVTLGDLVEGAGAVADIAVFRAPDPGTTGTVRAARVVAAAADHGLSLSGDGIQAVTVTRASRTVTPEAVAELVAEHLHAERPAAPGTGIDIRLDGFERAMHVEATAVAPLEIRSLEQDRTSGRFSALLAIADSRIAGAGIRVSGRANETVEVPVPARSIRRGETLAPGDISMERVARAQLRSGAVLLAEEAVGRAARRALRAGVPIPADSLMEPVLVGRNDPVTIVYRVPGLTLTARGRALGAGARGDVVTVINGQSNRTVEAEVTGAGVVAVAATGGPAAFAEAAR